MTEKPVAEALVAQTKALGDLEDAIEEAEESDDDDGSDEPTLF